MADLFEAAGMKPQQPSPLADRLRPQKLDEVVGQDHLLGPEGPIRRMAEAEIAHVPTESAEAAVRYVVLGSVLVEPLLLALRRVAEQVASAERFAGPDGD